MKAVCGTPQYVSPEVITSTPGQSYGPGVDCWVGSGQPCPPHSRYTGPYKSIHVMRKNDRFAAITPLLLL